MIHLGTVLFASSAVDGHKFAICAISNWVSADSLRSVLVVAYKVISPGRLACGGDSVALSDSRSRFWLVKFRKCLHVFQGLVVDTVAQVKVT